MKTIKEIAVESGIERTTLNKAIKRDAFPAHRSGATWLINTNNEKYKAWLEAHWKHHRTKEKREREEQNNVKDRGKSTYPENG